MKILGLQTYLIMCKTRSSDAASYPEALLIHDRRSPFGSRAPARMTLTRLLRHVLRRRTIGIVRMVRGHDFRCIVEIPRRFPCAFQHWASNPIHVILQLSSMNPENVIGRSARLSRSRADRDFTGSVGPGLGDRDFTSIPGRVQSEAFQMSVEPV